MTNPILTLLFTRLVALMLPQQVHNEWVHRHNPELATFGVQRPLDSVQHHGQCWWRAPSSSGPQVTLTQTVVPTDFLAIIVIISVVDCSANISEEVFVLFLLLFFFFICFVLLFGQISPNWLEEPLESRVEMC